MSKKLTEHDANLIQLLSRGPNTILEQLFRFSCLGIKCVTQCFAGKVNLNFVVLMYGQTSQTDCYGMAPLFHQK